MLTVACVYVRGHVAYSVEYVAKLRSMCQRYIPREFDFACLTDQPRAMPRGVRAVPILKHASLKGWWSKIELFKPGRFDGRVLYLDLDTLVVADLGEVIDYPSDFALAPDTAKFQGGEGLEVVKRFNSSVMVWDTGAQALHDLYNEWSPKVAARLWGDQDWIGEQCPQASAMPADWFPRLSTKRETWPVNAKVVLCKVPKNAVAAKLWPWFERAWG